MLHMSFPFPGKPDISPDVLEGSDALTMTIGVR